MNIRTMTRLLQHTSPHCYSLPPICNKGPLLLSTHLEQVGQLTKLVMEENMKTKSADPIFTQKNIDSL